MKPIPGSWLFTRWTTVNQLEALEVRHPLFSARLFLQGAHLTHFTPHDDSNWLWLSDTARFETGRAIRGGIPICWPWFGNPEKNPEAVQRHIISDDAHGFARTAIWNLEEVRETSQDVEISLSLSTNEDFRDQWDGKAQALITFRFTEHALQIALSTTNLDKRELAISQALHTYFPTDSIEQTRVTGLAHTAYIDTLQLWTRQLQRGVIEFTGETDRIYDTLGNDIGIQAPGVAYLLESSGSQSAVVWNPGEEKAARLSDFPNQAWRTMVCVETANALEDVRVLNCGQSHTLGVMISRTKATKEPQ